jgi:hypothetical protein
MYICTSKLVNMKNVLFGVAAVVLTACSSPAPETEVAIETTQLEVYGDSTMTPDGAISGTELLAQLQGKDSVVAKVNANITECCQKKGCWMEVDLGNGQAMHVKFKDYGFFVPMNSAGRPSILEGVAKVDTLSVEWLRHQAEDAGKTAEEIAAITEPKVTVSFLASGVIMQ